MLSRHMTGQTKSITQHYPKALDGQASLQFSQLRFLVVLHGNWFGCRHNKGERSAYEG